LDKLDKECSESPEEVVPKIRTGREEGREDKRRREVKHKSFQRWRETRKVGKPLS
jgi:hypothetical protein